jgi:hypothetical protein
MVNSIGSQLMTRTASIAKQSYGNAHHAKRSGHALLPGCLAMANFQGPRRTAWKVSPEK